MIHFSIPQVEMQQRFFTLSGDIHPLQSNGASRYDARRIEELWPGHYNVQPFFTQQLGACPGVLRQRLHPFGHIAMHFALLGIFFP